MQPPPPVGVPGLSHYVGPVPHSVSATRSGQPVLDRYNAPLRPHHFQQNPSVSMRRDINISDDGTQRSINSSINNIQLHSVPSPSSAISEDSIGQLSLPKR